MQNNKAFVIAMKLLISVFGIKLFEFYFLFCLLLQVFFIYFFLSFKYPSCFRDRGYDQ